ncbi:hypothetical protein TRIATDRAFT_310199 [Trichoderma atroviride IMI 206040]|uniref:Uncharacterized protein n=1 Tax=Hypocrea atroviridis (strain ATCC 20476 / IMI 206040) TaxID=452589 RepID=G9P217_HYPAI|nr:uncharacterized protein TRIATDRAFT_310199 [Trichoderma atroviride IMI 206040]EHK42612.1 hypothetical protein TRIATDRAFT_310199 [Trichoderma atroviride IMI 206040]
MMVNETESLEAGGNDHYPGPRISGGRQFSQSEHLGLRNAAPPLNLDKAVAYQFEVAKNATTQQLQQQALFIALDSSAS